MPRPRGSLLSRAVAFTFRKRFIAVAALAAASLSIAGCGGSDSDPALTESKLATYAPADALVFAEATVRPEGDLKDTIESILERFPRGDEVGDLLLAQIDESLSEEGLNYADDIEPWLGNRGAVFIPPSGPDDVVVLVESKDDDAATELIQATLEPNGPVTEKAVAGTTLYSGTDDNGDPTTVAISDGVVIASPAAGAVESALSAPAGARNFTGNTEYSGFIEEAGDGLLIGGYAEVEPLIDLAGASDPAAADQFEQFKRFIPALSEPILFSAAAGDDGVAIDISTAASELNPQSGEESDLFASIPPDAWAAFAVPGLGDAIQQAIGQFNSLQGQAKREFERGRAQVERQLGLDLADFGALGDAAFFAGGTSLLEIQVGAVAESTDEQATQRLLDSARKALSRDPSVAVGPLGISGAEGFTLRPQGLPVPINFAAADGRIAVAAGDRVTADLLGGNGGFDASPAYDDAKQSLGDGYALNLMLSIGPILELVEGTGQGGAEFEEARPYIDPIDFFAAGTRRDGDRDRSRFVIRFD